MQYELEVYCGGSLSPKLRSQRGTALQMGGRTAVQIGGVPPVLFRQVVQVGGSGGSKTVPIDDILSIHHVIPCSLRA